MSNVLQVPITQAQCTRAELSQAKIDGQVTPGRVYFLTDENVYVGGVSTTQTVDLVAQVQVVGYSVPGTGNVWDDVNAHMFTGPYADGEGRLPIGDNTLLSIGHNGVLYRWFGPAPVTIGAGGAGGIYPHHIVVDGDFVPSVSTSHAALDDRNLADQHPQSAITGLVADQAAQNGRLDTLEDHPGAINNPHGVTKAQVGLGNADNTSDVAKPISTATQNALNGLDGRLGVIEGHPTATNNPHGVTKAQVGLGNVDNTSDLAKPISTAVQNALNAKLSAVEQDTAPKLGGALLTNENEIRIAKINDDVVGVLGFGVGLDGDFVFFAKTLIDGTYDYTAGAFSADNNGLQFYGSSVYVDMLKDAAGTGRGHQVYVSDEGYLYGVDPPVPGWEASDSDIGVYDLGNGTGVGPWVELTGLIVVVPEDVAAGDRLDAYANLEVQNKTTNRSGSIEIGFGINSVAPANGEIRPVSAGFSGYIPVSVATTTHGGLTSGDTISVFARRASGSHAQFGLLMDGSGDDPHEIIVSVPGEGGGGVALPQQVSPAEKTAGTESALRSFSPLDVADMALAHGPGAGGAVDSVFGRTGVVVAQADDYDADQVAETVARVFFSPTEKVKLSGIAEGADVSPVVSVHGRTGAVTAVPGDYDADQISDTASKVLMLSTERTKLAGIAAGADVSPVASVHGRTGAVAAQADDYNADLVAESVTRKYMTDAEKTKLGGIEDNAKDDQTGAEIASALDAEIGNSAWRQPTGAVRTFFIPASAFHASVVNPAIWSTRETAAYSTIEGWDMAHHVDSLVQCWYPLPREQTGVLKFKTFWTQAGSGSGDVRWEGRVKGIGDGDSLDFLSSSSAFMTDAAQGADLLHVTNASGGYSPARAGADNLMRIDVWRNGNSAGDTLDEPVTFLGVFVQYVESETPPAPW